MEYQLSHTAEEIDERIGRATITGEGPPTSYTVGKIGQRYVNTLNWDSYMCISEAKGKYTWKLDTGGNNGPAVELDTTLSVEGKAADASAVGKALGNLEYLTATDDGNGIITLGKALMPSGGIVEVDATLSKAGKAADAKTVGDALKSTVKSVNGIEPGEDGNVNSVPFFDLVEMGLPAVRFDGVVSSVAADCTELCQAAKIGPVVVKVNVTDSNLDLTVPVIATCNGYHYEGNNHSALCGIVSSYAGVFSFTIEPNSDTIDVSLTRILDEYGKAASAVPYLDLSNFPIASLDTPISKIEMDASEILSVLNDGAKVINVGLSLEDIGYVEVALNVVEALGIYQLSGMISYIYDLDSSPAPYSVTILVTEGELIVYLSECMLYEEEDPSFYKVRISGSGDDWSTRADFKSAMDRYNFTGDITITTLNEERVESYVTQIEVGDMYDYMILHSADGVFRWTDSGVVEKIAEPPIVIGLPESTSSDDGKFLRLVNGVPTWVGLVNAEEVSF
jgi:hypothetical protein